MAAIPGELPDPAIPIVGCPFASRCRYVMEVCRSVEPPLIVDRGTHGAACHLVENFPQSPLTKPTLSHKRETTPDPVASLET